MYWLTGTIGVLLLMAPFLFGYIDNVGAFWTSLLIGAAIVVVSFIEGVSEVKQSWEYWTAEGLGLLAIFAPFLFGFNSHATAMWTSVVMGIVLMVLAGAKLFSFDRHPLKYG